MNSATFQVCYASVANALFEHIEQDLLHLTTALLDDDDDHALRLDTCSSELLTHRGVPPP